MNLRLALSNLAWPADQEDAVLSVVSDLGVKGVEVAPTRLGEWIELSVAGMTTYRARLASYGLSVSSLQAVLYGRPDLQLLQDTALFATLLDHMRYVADLGAALGAQVMVLGAPRNRLLGGLLPDEAWQRGRERLRKLGEVVASTGMVIGIEPIPPSYGGEFLTTWSEVARIVREVDHRSIRLHLDTGCVKLGGDAIADAIIDASDILAHFHVAEENLGGFSNPAMDHRCASKALHQVDYRGWVCIEMREQPETFLQAIRVALKYVASVYCETQGHLATG
jgi:sugar phosphate isomerase/epimerase